MKGLLTCGMTGWQVICGKCGHKAFINKKEHLSPNEAKVWIRVSGWEWDMVWICPYCAKGGQDEED